MARVIQDRLTGFWRFALIAASLFAVILACLPDPPDLPGSPSDTLQHAFAFVTLTLLALAAFPQARAWSIFLGLGCLGGAIELLQAIPRLNRQPSLEDLIVDLAAIAFTLGISATIVQLRRGQARGASADNRTSE